MPGWLIAVAVIVIFAAAAFWWWVPKWQANLLRMKIRDAKARADVEDNFRKTIGQLLGGAAVLAGAGFAYYQSQLTQQATHDQIKATYDQLISQQVAKGFEQLGSGNVATKLGGIYALEGVMNTSEQYHQPVLEALCAFVRDNAKVKDTKNEPAGPVKPATDIQAALTVIGRRKPGPGLVDLNSANLSAANLGAANLSFANLGNANLSGADLFGANLANAYLFGANLSGADLGDAYLIGANLNNADLFGANLNGANLSGADLRSFKKRLGNPIKQPLDGACGDKETKLDEGLTIKPCQP